MYDKLTKSDIKKMEEEIEYRKLVVRPKAVDDVREAAAQGDRSENFEYYAAKRFNRQNNLASTSVYNKRNYERRE